MTEWWTYRLDSFLLFSARTYQRLLESYNAEVWPLQMVTLLAGIGLLLWLGRPHSPRRDRVVVPLLWCLFSGAMLWALRAGHAWVPPAVGVLAVVCLLWRRKFVLHHF